MEIYARENGLNIRYKNKLCGQRKKYYISNLELGNKTYISYPTEAKSEGEAEEVAAQAAEEDIKNNAGNTRKVVVLNDNTLRIQIKC